MHQEIVKKRRGKLTWGVLLLQDNAQAHTSQVAMAAETKCSFKVLPHLLYSPDLAPSVCFQIWKVTFVLGILEAMKASSVEEHLGDQKEGFCFEGISKLEHLWRKLIKGRLYWEIMAQFLLLVNPKVQGLRTFWRSSLVLVDSFAELADNESAVTYENLMVKIRDFALILPVYFKGIL